jgi:hypothetical protein
MKRIMVALATLAFSGAALAFHCPKDMKQIDAALEKTSLGGEQLAEVKKLRADGEAFHKAGKHQEAVDSLGKAMKLLGI